ncbi:hypothetical protein BBI10_13915 [Pseudomonas graminis]|uniref:Uncharacterized protein n=1 Tax=Pseudomonas graminis TaxID=158627 RepID=A0A1C2DXL9_9PSED|nr:hypothetical protein BBI10_13915 [Pseudomonas graminis]
MRDVESCEGHEPRAIAFERHECGIFRTQSFDSIGKKMAEQIGAKFKSVATNYTDVIFTPAQNVNGAVIRTATMHIGSSYGILTTGATAPNDYYDVSKPVILSVRGTAPAGSGFPGASATLPFQVTIPAGQGLWVAMGQGGGGQAYVTYDLLPAA